MKRLLPITIAALALAACASKTPDDAAAKPAEQAKAAPPQKTVFDPELQALQRAKDVQKAIDAGDANNRKAIDDAEKDDDGGG
jgi:PBP1b-binding outer membrane lipoprotein LpoB